VDTIFLQQLRYFCKNYRQASETYLEACSRKLHNLSKVDQVFVSTGCVRSFSSCFFRFLEREHKDTLKDIVFSQPRRSEDMYSGYNFKDEWDALNSFPNLEGLSLWIENVDMHQSYFRDFLYPNFHCSPFLKLRILEIPSFFGRVSVIHEFLPSSKFGNTFCPRRVVMLECCPQTGVFVSEISIHSALGDFREKIQKTLMFHHAHEFEYGCIF
jgi:hypothetical protein